MIKEYSYDGLLNEAIHHRFGSSNGLKKEIMRSANSIFGNGWIWLIMDDCGQLNIKEEIDAVSPKRKHLKPILGIDLCEDAYRLDYPNNRSDYINSFWQLIDWDIIALRYRHFYNKSANKVIQKKSS